MYWQNAVESSQLIYDYTLAVLFDKFKKILYN